MDSCGKLEKISILVPTLSRPANMEDFATSANATTKNKNDVTIAFGIHADDQISFNKIIELKNRLSIKIDAVMIDKPQEINLSILWNQIYAKTIDPIVGFFGDDVIFRTFGWDEIVQEEFSKDKKVLVFGNDYLQSGRVATLFFTHRLVHDSFGYYMNPKFRREFMDTWWDNIYRANGKLHYRADIITEHMHPEKFPEREDEVYKKSIDLRHGDRALWESKENKRLLKNAIGAFKKIGVPCKTGLF